VAGLVVVEYRVLAERPVELAQVRRLAGRARPRLAVLAILHAIAVEVVRHRREVLVVPLVDHVTEEDEIVEVLAGERGEDGIGLEAPVGVAGERHAHDRGLRGRIGGAERSHGAHALARAEAIVVARPGVEPRGHDLGGEIAAG
jgi:hypothetical protein